MSRASLSPIEPSSKLPVDVDVAQAPQIRALVADDEHISRQAISRCLQRAGYDVVLATDGQEAIEKMEDDILVALLDLNMPRVTGIDCLKQIRSQYPDTQVIMVSGAGQIKDAVGAMKEGALEYVTKPFDREELLVHVEQAVTRAKLGQDNRGLKEAISSPQPVRGLIGETAVTQDLKARTEKIAQLDSNVLILGESGTGKSTIARMIHQSGPRSAAPFVAVNCASLPRDLIESELFGHTKGAFTGAVKDRPGRAEIADGGTLFLDEIGDLPLDLQPKLLTFLQDHTVQRIGCNKIRRVDVRVITATLQDLGALCQERLFREDLYYRLNVLGLRVPSLRERPEDLPLLAQNVLDRIASKRQLESLSLSDEALTLLSTYEWPGNIRELENTLERASAFCENDLIQPRDIEFSSLRRTSESFASPAATSSLAGRSLADIEQQAIEETLVAFKGNKAQSARELGISEKSIYNKMRRHGILPPSS